MTGYIKLHRSVKGHWLYDNHKYSEFQAWIDLLLHASFKDKKVNLKGRLIDVKRGQQIRSELTLARDWGWSRNKVRSFLLMLAADGMIEHQKDNLTSYILIRNYDEYQSQGTPEGHQKEHQIKHQKDTRRTPEGTQYKNDKKEKKEKNSNIYADLLDLMGLKDRYISLQASARFAEVDKWQQQMMMIMLVEDYMTKVADVKDYCNRNNKLPVTPNYYLKAITSAGNSDREAIDFDKLLEGIV